MKIALHRYSQQFPKLFNKEKKLINEVLREVGNFEIHHIGSTSVPGLNGKGIIDTLIAIKDWKKREGYIKKLKRIGFRHIHAEEKGRIFLSRIRKTKKGDTHVHLVKTDGKEYKSLLSFRDYLQKNRQAAKEYGKAKKKLIKEARDDRIQFGNLKDEYIKTLMKKIK